MGLRTNFFLVVFMILFLGASSGCYNTPVRHLAADVALLKVGQTTGEDVVVFLGEPDERQELAAGVEKWIYFDKEMTVWEKTPVVGKRIGAPEYKLAMVTITNNIVTEVIYTSYDKDDLDWEDDYYWQENR